MKLVYIVVQKRINTPIDNLGTGPGINAKVNPNQTKVKKSNGKVSTCFLNMTCPQPPGPTLGSRGTISNSKLDQNQLLPKLP